MENYRRFAVYSLPREGAFLAAAEAWLGRSVVTGAPVRAVDLAGLDLPARQITQEPRRYGFHATLKAPFRLANGQTPDSLLAALQALAARLPPLPLEGLELARLGSFLALVPKGPTDRLQAFAAQVVEALDPLRAPLRAEEVARRKPESLTPRQRALLDHWGYPYVMEEFRFHMTLTDKLDPQQAKAVQAVLLPYFAPVLPNPFVIEDLCLFAERSDGMFDLLHRVQLSG